jgi:transcriptional regulator with GAF, ATPase, and Fis domain
MHKEIKIIGISFHIKKLRGFVDKAAKSDSNVLILGETGVGKELAAKAIHFESNRKDKPFIKLNCGNLNENLVESELFGHRKGAFTGAFVDKPGLIEAANGGTFFFDEIGDITLSLQAKMLSVIEDKEIRRLGDSNTRQIDVRFIFATNKDLYNMVTKGKFRKDLFYRIDILTVHISPLRERIEDIPLLIEEILSRENRKKSINFAMTKEAMNKVTEYYFPGNIRELENILIRATEFSTCNIIKECDISFQQVQEKKSLIKRDKYGINKIVDILVKCNGNKTKAARELGISRVHLYRLLNFKEKNRNFSQNDSTI